MVTTLVPSPIIKFSVNDPANTLKGLSTSHSYAVCFHEIEEWIQGASAMAAVCDKFTNVYVSRDGVPLGTDGYIGQIRNGGELWVITTVHPPDMTYEPHDSKDAAVVELIRAAEIFLDEKG